MWSVSYVTCVDIKAQVSLTLWSIFVFLDGPTLKLKIIINILPTGRPEIILPTAGATKNWVDSALLFQSLFELYRSQSLLQLISRLFYRFQYSTTYI